MDGVERESVNGARCRESHLAGVFRTRPGADVGRFRDTGRKAVASGIAGLARGGLRGQRLAGEAPAKGNPDVSGLPAVIEGPAGARIERSGERAAGTPIAGAPARGADSGPGAGGEWSAQSSDRRPEHSAAAAQGRGGAVLRRREMAREHGSRSLSPRPLYLLPAHRAVSAIEQFRRARFERRVYPAWTIEHTAASFEFIERSGILRSCAGACE